jgi:hypothetical protein
MLRPIPMERRRYRWARAKELQQSILFRNIQQYPVGIGEVMLADGTGFQIF